MRYASDIYEVMRNKFLQLNQTITNFNVGSRIRSTFEAAGLAIEELWFRLDTMYQGLFAATAHEDDLDLRALELGLQRRPAKKSSGYVRFYGSESTEIPVDTICSTDPDIEPTIEFLTTAQKTIPAAEYIDVPVQAKEAGASGNVEAEKVIYLPQSISGIDEIKNLEAIAGADDEEDDESLRRRNVLRWYALSFGGCEEAYRSWALEFDGVAEAHAVACWKGPGTMKILIWSKNEEGKLIPGSSELLETIQNEMDLKKSICSDITVAQPTGALVDVLIILTKQDGYLFSVVSENVKNIIMTYFNNLGVGDDVITSQLLAQMMAVPGVADIKIGQPRNNIECASTETIMLGRCRIESEEWGTEHAVW